MVIYFINQILFKIYCYDCCHDQISLELPVKSIEVIYIYIKAYFYEIKIILYIHLTYKYYYMNNINMMAYIAMVRLCHYKGKRL